MCVVCQGTGAVKKNWYSSRDAYWTYCTCETGRKLFDAEFPLVKETVSKNQFKKKIQWPEIDDAEVP